VPKQRALKPPTQDGRSADPAINAYAQMRLEQWLADHPDKKAVDLAEAAGTSAYVVSVLKTKGEGVGWRTARQLAKVFGLTLSEFVAEADRYWEERRAAKGFHSLRESPEWAAARSEVIAKHGANESAVDAAGEWRVHLATKLNGDVLWGLVAASQGTVGEQPKTSRRR
jgi:hypothetical protein